MTWEDSCQSFYSYEVARQRVLESCNGIIHRLENRTNLQELQQLQQFQLNLL